MHTNRNRNSTGGFTLIELLVVITIVGILASIVFASLSTARQKSRDARRIADIKQIQLALELYANSNAQEYPDTTAALKTAGFIPDVPKDPTTSVNYPYNNFTSSTFGTDCAIAGATDPPCVFYRLGALLEDGTNAALRGDRDHPAAAVLPGSDGLSAQPACGVDNTATVLNDRCYDVTN